MGCSRSARFPVETFWLSRTPSVRLLSQPLSWVSLVVSCAVLYGFLPCLGCLVAFKRLEQVCGERTIYTDGSLDAGFKDGGLAAVVHPTQSQSIMKKDAAYTSLYEEEDQAMKDVITWIISAGA